MSRHTIIVMFDPPIIWLVGRPPWKRVNLRLYFGPYSYLTPIVQVEVSLTVQAEVSTIKSMMNFTNVIPKWTASGADGLNSAYSPRFGPSITKGLFLFSCFGFAGDDNTHSEVPIKATWHIHFTTPPC